MKDMIVNIIICLWFLFIAFLAVIAINRFFNGNLKYHFVNYEKVEAPYITLDIQGNQLNFLVDSGAAISVIKKDVLEALDYKESPQKVKLQTLISNEDPSNMVIIPIRFGNKIIEGDFMVYDTDDLCQYGIMYGVVLHGIIGNEFLRKGNCKIDYKNRTVVFNS